MPLLTAAAAVTARHEIGCVWKINVTALTEATAGGTFSSRLDFEGQRLGNIHGVTVGAAKGNSEVSFPQYGITE